MNNIFKISLALTAGIFLSATQAMAISVNISGTVIPATPGQYRPIIDTSTLFDPASGSPISMTGSVDVSNLSRSDILFAGLISKIDYDMQLAAYAGDTNANFFAFLDTAYGTFQGNYGGGMVNAVGLGQYLQGGETTQGRATLAGNNVITDFRVLFDDAGMSLEVEGQSKSLNYDFSSDTLTYTADFAGNAPYTDWSQGAYAFLGIYFGADTGTSAVFDLNFDGPGALVDTGSVVPLPAGLPLFGTGLALIGFVSWRRKRKAA